MRGQVVVCKDFNGAMIELVVWEDSAALIFIHSEDQFKTHSDAMLHLELVGFRVEDVFIYNSTTI